MNLSELLVQLKIMDKKIIAHLVIPVRKEEEYKSGEVIGFKPGIYGGGHSEYKKEREGITRPHSFNGLNMYWLKKPKVMISYSCFTYGKRQHFDWVDIDNCNFEIIDISKKPIRPVFPPDRFEKDSVRIIKENLEISKFFRNIRDWLEPKGFTQVYSNHPLEFIREFHFYKDGIRIKCIRGSEEYCTCYVDVVKSPFSLSLESEKFEVGSDRLEEFYETMKKYRDQLYFYE